MKLKKTIQKYMGFVFLLMLTVGVLLIFSCSTSPLYPNFYGMDSALFRFIGRSLLKGKILYKDIWDNKGPFLFLIQAFGAFRGTRNNPVNIIFLLQICSLSSVVLIMAGIDHTVHPTNRGSIPVIFAAVCTLSVFCKTMQFGNLTEEWSLPFICFSLYLMVKYAADAESSVGHPCGYAFWHGISFASLAFIRISNAISICGGLAIIGVYLIKNRRWKNLFANIAAGITGIALIVVPVCIYFYWKDALAEMIYAVFLYNLKYTGEKTHGAFSGTDLLLRYLPLTVAAMILAVHMLRNRRIQFTDILMMGIVVANAVLLIKTNIYPHYFTVFSPVFFAVLLICLKDRSCMPEILLAVVVLAFFALQDAKMIPELKNMHGAGPRFASAENIPRDERSSAIAINVLPEIYLYTGIEPCSRFAAYQSTHLSVEPKFADQFIETLQNVRPIWIIISGAHNQVIPGFQAFLADEYHYEFNDPSADYYRVNR